MTFAITITFGETSLFPQLFPPIATACGAIIGAAVGGWIAYCVAKRNTRSQINALNLQIREKRYTSLVENIGKVLELEEKSRTSIIDWVVSVRPHLEIIHLFIENQKSPAAEEFKSLYDQCCRNVPSDDWYLRFRGASVTLIDVERPSLLND